MATTRSRQSDPHLPAEEAARLEAQVCGYIDSVAPSRPVKPPRSDPLDAGLGGAEEAVGDDLPELRRLRGLVAKPQKFVLDGGDANGEEYVETQYYPGINCIDKQHHTQWAISSKTKDKAALEGLTAELRRLYAENTPARPSSSTAPSP